MSITQIKTLGELRLSGYVSKSIKEEMRANLINKLKNKEKIFEGIEGFDETVIPDIERAILSRHNILLLGLRGQAKTRLARKLVHLLDPHIPIIEGSDLNDDPLDPISKYAKRIIEEKGDKTPISWLSREERYVEKLATPDVSIADLIGDVDPIKAASLKLPYSDDRVIHFGLVPRSHRSIFVINEIPDLQARIQVSLFNILQEGDLQIRGFKIRLPLDIQFVFTANPEDYTNRGSIITPLKDRIESQILTHYPMEIDIAKKITHNEARITEAQKEIVTVPDILKTIVEKVSFEARESELIDEKSGVSARLSISAFENLVSTAERRAIKNNEMHTTARMADLLGIIPAITGKVELVYEGEQLGPYEVALQLIGQAIKNIFLEKFPHPDSSRKGDQRDPYEIVRSWFGDGNEITLDQDASNEEYERQLDSVAGLNKLIKGFDIENTDLFIYMELALHALSELEVISKDLINNQSVFGDPLADIFDDLND